MTCPAGMLHVMGGYCVWPDLACSGAQVTSLGSEAKLGTDFADVYANSKLAK